MKYSPESLRSLYYMQKHVDSRSHKENKRSHGPEFAKRLPVTSNEAENDKPQQSRYRNHQSCESLHHQYRNSVREEMEEKPVRPLTSGLSDGNQGLAACR